MQKCKRSAFGIEKALTSAVLAGGINIIYGALMPVFAGEASDIFVPIKDSTSNDPAGFQLMVISIGILVTMVGAIFTVTMIYMLKGNKKKRPAPPDNVE